MTKTLLSIALVLGVSSLAAAAPTDIVPRGAALNDAFAQLARDGYLGSNFSPGDFLGEPLHTRAQLARLLDDSLLADPDSMTHIALKPSDAAALRAALIGLEPELGADQVDVESLLASLPEHSLSAGLLLQPEARSANGGSQSPGSGTMGIYRGTALGDLGPQFRFVGSVSNWQEDWRRSFYNDIGAHGQSGVNEAYLELHNRRGLTFDIGRQYDRWGPGYRGATLLSDNAQAFDQIQLAFPFSLGRHFGRNYRFDQVAATFKEGGQQKYLEVRRIEYAFSSQWNAEFEEAFKSSASGTLIGTVVPFNIQTPGSLPIINFIPGVKFPNFDNRFNYNLNLGLSYSASPNVRLYGQFMIDDMRNPLGSQTKVVPRKIAYLIGGSAESPRGTGLTLEYSHVDPTTYTYQNTTSEWTRGTFEYVGLPTGPNSREIFGRLSQRITPRFSLALSGRDRKRINDTFPAPNSRDLAADAICRINRTNDVTLSYHDYRQDPYPYTPGSPNYPSGNGFQPQSEGNPGESLRIKELDVAYQFYF